MKKKLQFIGTAGAVALFLTMSALTSAGASAATNDTVPPPPVAASDESCWYAIDTGEGLCVKTGDDLVAAVAADKGIDLVLPEGEVVSGVPAATARTSESRANALRATIAVSTIYDDADYGGGSYTMSVTNGGCQAGWSYGYTDLGAIGWTNRVSSFKSYSGCTTAVWERTSYSGSSYGYAVNASSLGAMNDKARSWRVAP